MADVNNRESIQTLVGDAYELQWVIGHGGMSTVWLADDHANDREVAIKILRPEFSDNNEFWIASATRPMPRVALNPTMWSPPTTMVKSQKIMATRSASSSWNTFAVNR